MIFTGQTKEKWGICFAGGGGKGAYEIGVWKALEEKLGTKKFQAVSGASVGALNAALFATMCVKEAEDLWLKITPNQILQLKEEETIEFLKSIIFKNTIYNKRGMGGLQLVQ